ncbi:MAG: hypothetical protein LBG28_09705 [Tannerella sp.]|jgi:hypothetical protein|nr:hypothetical protein [Tannerella sp.]
MKKTFKFLAALTLSAGMLATQGLSAQQRVVKVQGHPHEYLTKKVAEGQARTAVTDAPTDTVYINPDNIFCWIDDSELDPTLRIDSAYLIIKWTDHKAIDSVFIWGYRWNANTLHHGIDMLRTVANNDRRLTVLLQYAGQSGHTVGGIGVNQYEEGTFCSRVELDFDLIGARTEGYVDFQYFDSPDCADGQVAVPDMLLVNTLIENAATESRYTGILEHPFGVEYGYPAYDYDYWSLTGYIQAYQHWQAGWTKNGFWGYFRADNRRVPIPSSDFDNDPDAAQFGITYEPLLNQQVHGFVFESNFVVYQFDGEPRYMDCRCAPCTEENKGGSKR